MQDGTTLDDFSPWRTQDSRKNGYLLHLLHPNQEVKMAGATEAGGTQDDAHAQTESISGKPSGGDTRNVTTTGNSSLRFSDGERGKSRDRSDKLIHWIG